MKKTLSTIALFGALSLTLTSTASAKCCEYKDVCEPKYKYKTVWKTCYNSYNVPYPCKKRIRIKIGEKCHKKCVSHKEYCGNEENHENTDGY